MKAEPLFDFFLQKIGPTVYNVAIRDAHACSQGRVLNLDGAWLQA